MNYLYNGIELPDINEVWTDKATYPYALIAWNSATGKHRLAVCAQKANYGPAATAIWCINMIPYMQYTQSDNWEYQGTFTAENINANTLWPQKEMPVVWANYDVLNGDGTVYLKASEPIPVGGEPIDPTSMLMGWLVGRQVASMRGKTKREPVAYLYNGVRLPDINEVWTDKETYPYAFIVYHDAYNDIYDRYELWISADEPYMREYSGLHQLMVAGAECYFLTDSVWTLEYTFEDDWQAIDSQYEGDTCIWSNVDILDLDGSILSAASEPIPVYE